MVKVMSPLFVAESPLQFSFGVRAKTKMKFGALNLWQEKGEALYFNCLTEFPDVLNSATFYHQRVTQ